MLESVYVLEENNSKQAFLHLDGGLRPIPPGSTFQNLFGETIEQAKYNVFKSREQAPYGFIDYYPISEKAKLYTINNNPDEKYLLDELPWFQDRSYLRKVVNRTQLNKLGFVNPTPWTGEHVPEIIVPLAIDTNMNLLLATFFSGYHLYYNHLSHPENPLRYPFTRWLENNFSKAEVRRRILYTQRLISFLSGEIPVGAPAFKPPGGTNHHMVLPVSMTSTTARASIYYSTDGNDPVPGISPLYTGPVDLALAQSSSGITLKAIAEYHDSIGVSSVTSADYSYEQFNVATPTFDPIGGRFEQESVNVTISCTTENVDIYYSTDNSTPQVRSENRYRDGEPVVLNILNSQKTIKAIAVHREYGGQSLTGVATYTYLPPKLANPTFSPTQSSFVGPNVFVSISHEDQNATILYSIGPDRTPNLEYDIPLDLFFEGRAGIEVEVFAQATDEASGSRPSEIVSKTYEGENSWNHVWELLDDSNDSIGAINLDNTGVTYASNTPAAVFNGSSILTTGNTDTIQSPDFTITAWVNLTSMPEAPLAPVWVYENISTGHNGPAIFIHPDGTIQGQTIKKDGSYVQCNSSAGAITTGSWYQIVLVTDLTNVNLYLNGQSLAINQYDGTLDTTKCERFNIGAELSRGNEPSIRHGLSAHINRVYYFGLPLNAEYVQRLYDEER